MMSRIHLQMVVMGILSVVAVLARTHALDLMEFKEDEVTSLQSQELMLSSGEIPRHGQMSSLGIPQPPLFYYLMGPWYRLFHSPVGANCLIVLGGIAAAGVLTLLATTTISLRAGVFLLALLAASPWLVIYSRKIWTQNLLPPFICLMMQASLRITRIPRSRTIFFIPILAAIIAGLHFSGVCTVVATMIFIMSVVGWRPLNFPALALGCIVMGIMMAPYLGYLWDGGLADLSSAIAQGTASSPPDSNLIRSMLFTSHVVGLGGLEAIMGSDFVATNPGISLSAEIVSRLMFCLIWGFVAIRLLTFAVKMQREAEWSRIFRTDAVAVLCVLHLIMPILMYSVGNVAVIHHYFIISAPAGLLLIVSTIDSGRRYFTAKCSVERKSNILISYAYSGITIIIGLIVFGSGSLWLIAQTRYLEKQGGALGDYGTTYRSQLAMAQQIVASAGPDTKIEFRDFPKVPTGILYLIKQIRGATYPDIPVTAREIIIRNILSVDTESAILEPGEQRLGPFAFQILGAVSSLDTMNQDHE